MKIEGWWKCEGCDLAHKDPRRAKKCHEGKIHRISFLVDDNGKPINPPTKLQRRNEVDEDDTFGLMSDLSGMI